MFADLVTASDAKVYSALANKGRDVGSGKEDKSDRVVLDQGDVKSVVSSELDVGSGE